MNVFILTVDYDREAYLAALDATPMVRNWLSFLSSAVAIATHRSASEIASYLHERLPGHQFILLPASAYAAGGYLMQPVWSFIAEPQDSGKHFPDFQAVHAPQTAASYLTNLGSLTSGEGQGERVDPFKGLLSGLPHTKNKGGQ